MIFIFIKLDKSGIETVHTNHGVVACTFLLQYTEGSICVSRYLLLHVLNTTMAELQGYGRESRWLGQASWTTVHRSWLEWMASMSSLLYNTTAPFHPMLGCRYWELFMISQLFVLVGAILTSIENAMEVRTGLFKRLACTQPFGIPIR